MQPYHQYSVGHSNYTATQPQDGEKLTILICSTVVTIIKSVVQPAPLENSHFQKEDIR
jgi:hypothetical protein